MISKRIKISECSELLAEIIEECRQSENQMWFVEFGTMKLGNVKRIKEEVKKLGLEDCITFLEDDCLITVYGGVLDEIIF